MQQVEKLEFGCVHSVQMSSISLLQSQTTYVGLSLTWLQLQKKVNRNCFHRLFWCWYSVIASKSWSENKPGREDANFLHSQEKACLSLPLVVKKNQQLSRTRENGSGSKMLILQAGGPGIDRQNPCSKRSGSVAVLAIPVLGKKR